jgi:2OG-Fe(II) oxygenase superfamily
MLGTLPVPLASINVNFYGEDQELGWHFDNAKFALTLMPRQAVSGGAFEYAPTSARRTRRAIGGSSASWTAMQRELKQDPGALVLFKGSRSLHRVTPSFGRPPRTIAILSYAGEPGQGLKDHTRLLFYGRRE